MIYNGEIVDFLFSRPTGSQHGAPHTFASIPSVNNPDHVGGYQLAGPILAGMESKFGLLLPKFTSAVPTS